MIIYEKYENPSQLIHIVFRRFFRFPSSDLILQTHH